MDHLLLEGKAFTPDQWVPTGNDLASPGNIWPCPEAFLVVTTKRIYLLVFGK